MKLTKIFLAVFLSASVLFFSCAPKDSDVQADISEKFAATPELAGATATVDKGVATITGALADEAARTEAEKAANDVKGVKSVVNNTTVMAPPPPPPPPMAPPVSSTGMEQGVMDATKDFPEVTATVNNGEITLTGTLNRSDLPTLMQSLNALNPSKINNELTLK